MVDSALQIPICVLNFIWTQTTEVEENDFPFYEDTISFCWMDLRGRFLNYSDM